MGEQQLRIEVSAYDLDELKAALPPNTIEVVREKPEDAHGEPILIAILIIAPLVIQAIAAWALKQRRKGSIEIRAEKVLPDGTRETVTTTVKMSSSSTSADVVKQLQDGMRLDPSLVQAVAGLEG